MPGVQEQVAKSAATKPRDDGLAWCQRMTETGGISKAGGPGQLPFYLSARRSGSPLTSGTAP